MGTFCPSLLISKNYNDWDCISNIRLRSLKASSDPVSDTSNNQALFILSEMICFFNSISLFSVRVALTPSSISWPITISLIHHFGLWASPIFRPASTGSYRLSAYLLLCWSSISRMTSICITPSASARKGVLKKYLSRSAFSVVPAILMWYDSFTEVMKLALFFNLGYGWNPG